MMDTALKAAPGASRTRQRPGPQKGPLVGARALMKHAGNVHARASSPTPWSLAKAGTAHDRKVEEQPPRACPRPAETSNPSPSDPTG